MQFDFSGLRYDTPKHLVCILADKNEFTVCDAKRSKFFRIRKTAVEEFSLWSWSVDTDGPTEQQTGHFIMRGELIRLLTLIGYFYKQPHIKRAFEALEDLITWHAPGRHHYADPDAWGEPSPPREPPTF